MAEKTRHYHIHGLCREHGPKMLGVFDTEAEARERVHDLPREAREVGHNVSNVETTSNTVEFETEEKDGNRHYYAITVVYHTATPEEYEECKMLNMMETTIARLAISLGMVPGVEPQQKEKPSDDPLRDAPVDDEIPAFLRDLFANLPDEDSPIA